MGHTGLLCLSAESQLVNTNLSKCPKDLKAKAYTTLVRPVIEYEVANISKLERIQRHRVVAFAT